MQNFKVLKYCIMKCKILDFSQKFLLKTQKPFHADTPFENGGGGVDEKSSAAAAFGGGVQAC